MAFAAGLLGTALCGAAATGAGVLGVSIASPPAPWQAALVVNVLPDSAAARAGLRPQDLIVQADAQSISSPLDLGKYLANRRVGERVTLTVMRVSGGAGERLQLTATLGPAPAQAQGTGAATARPSAPQTAAVAGAAAQGLTHIAWSSFTDPYEHAFTMDVPQGWKVAGGVVRKNPLWPALVMRVLAPDRRTLIAIGDPDNVPWNTPIAARDYVRRFTESAIGSACSGLKILDVKDQPDVERYASSHTPGPYIQWSAAQAVFTCNGERQGGMSGQALAVLEYMTSLRSGHAQILAAFVTTAGQESAANQIVDHMVGSLKQDPNWTAREQQEGQRLAAGAMARWRGEQQQFQAMDDAITNTAHFVGADGRRYDLDSRPRYQWLTPNGQTAGTDSPTPPSVGSQLLQRAPE
jgi:hypothetical protein